MPTINDRLRFQEQPVLDHILIGLGYASRELLGDHETFKSFEESGRLDQFLNDRGIQLAMLAEARLLQAILLGQASVPAKGIVFGSLTDNNEILMAVARSEPPFFVLVLVASTRPMTSGPSPLTAAAVFEGVLAQSREDGDNSLGHVVLAEVELPGIPVATDSASDPPVGSRQLLLPGDPSVDALFAALKQQVEH